jgi:hypothetical protein
MLASTFTLNIIWLEKNSCVSNNYASSITTIKLRSSVLNNFVCAQFQLLAIQ